MKLFCASFSRSELAARSLTKEIFWMQEVGWILSLTHLSQFFLVFRLADLKRVCAKVEVDNVLVFYRNTHPLFGHEKVAVSFGQQMSHLAHALPNGNFSFLDVSRKRISQCSFVRFSENPSDFQEDNQG
jgi:uncharacterized metal-binding protein